MNTTYTLMCTHTHTHRVKYIQDSIRFICPVASRFQETAGRGWLCCWGPRGDRMEKKHGDWLRGFRKSRRWQISSWIEKTYLVSSWRKHTCHLFLDDRPLVWKWNSATRPKLWIDDSYLEPVIIQWKVNSDEESCTMTSSDGDVSHCIVWYRIVLYLYDIVRLQFACILMHTAYTGFIPV